MSTRVSRSLPVRSMRILRRAQAIVGADSGTFLHDQNRLHHRLLQTASPVSRALIPGVLIGRAAVPDKGC